MKGYLFILRTSKGAYREGNGNSLQYSCLGNPMDREAWRAAGLAGYSPWGRKRVGQDLSTEQQGASTTISASLTEV